MNFINELNQNFFINLKENQVILDYGSGNGDLSVFFLNKGLKVYSVDIDNNSEKLILNKIDDKNKKNFQFFQLNAEKDYFPIKSVKFDYIICREVLEHINNYEKLIEEFYTLLKPNGLLIISIPTSFSEKYFMMLDKNWLNKSQHVNIFKKKFLINTLIKKGFTISKIEGTSFKWFLFWFLLSPFKVDHIMGNPLNKHKIVSLVLRIINKLSSINFINSLGNKVLPKSYVFYITKYKPKVLVVYDYYNWILGKWARNIKKNFSDNYDIYIASMFVIRKEKSKLKKIIKNIDFIHILLPHCFNDIYDISYKKPIISIIHHWVNWTKIYEDTANKSFKIITVSNEWKNKLIQKNIEPNKIIVINNGIESNFFNSIHKSFLDKSNKSTIGFFAKNDSNEFDRKGIKNLIELLTFIYSKDKQNLFRIVISGYGWNYLVKKIQELGFEVIYLKFVDEKDMPSLYNSIDFYLVLSNVEGGPVTILEAMACKSIVLTTRVGLANDIIIDKHNGIFIENTNYDDIFNKLIFLINNKDLAEKIKINAYNFVKNNMTFDKTLKPIYDLYSQTTKSIGKLNIYSKINRDSEIFKEFNIEEVND